MVTLSYIHLDDPIHEETLTNRNDAIKRAKKLQAAYSSPGDFEFIEIRDSKTQAVLVTAEEFKAM